jgi:uncharacterized membrane protein YeaQ/YmgE (transglycosylase-associated protein family)
MDSAQMLEAMQQWSNDLLVWVGFGTIVGLLAKAIMPGKDPGGAIATLIMGIGGTVIGCGILAYFSGGTRITPISPAGFCVATAGAFIILFFYKMLGGYWFVEGQGPIRRRLTTRRSLARRPAATVLVEED